MWWLIPAGLTFVAFSTGSAEKDGVYNPKRFLPNYDDLMVSFYKEWHSAQKYSEEAKRQVIRKYLILVGQHLLIDAMDRFLQWNPSYRRWRRYKSPTLFREYLKRNLDRVLLVIWGVETDQTSNPLVVGINKSAPPDVGVLQVNLSFAKKIMRATAGIVISVIDNAILSTGILLYNASYAAMLVKGIVPPLKMIAAYHSPQEVKYPTSVYQKRIKRYAEKEGLKLRY